MSIEISKKQIVNQPVELPTDRPIERPEGQNGDRIIEQLIRQIPLNCYPGTMIGVEKESLRIRRDGYISHAPHPHILGSSLTHPCITIV